MIETIVYQEKLHPEHDKMVCVVRQQRDQFSHVSYLVCVGYPNDPEWRDARSETLKVTQRGFKRLMQFMSSEKLQAIMAEEELTEDAPR